ncbi:hypothetical protein ACO0QE_001206 [Hanseniaspora vineae]
MKFQKDAVSILQRTSDFLEKRVINEKPKWYDVVMRTPPNTQFSRVPRFENNPSHNKPLYKDQVASSSLQNLKSELYKSSNSYKPFFFKTRPSQKDRGLSDAHLYKPYKLKYFEDKLREIFYDQHPWERSRPKLMIENTKVLDSKLDWSTMKQLTKPLDGESVIQRTLYLVNTEGTNLSEAYELAKFEFYQLRIEEEFENQIAREEAELQGALFRESAVEFGFNEEQKYIKYWKKKAIEKTELLQAQSSDNSGFTTGKNNEDEAERTEEHVI